MRSASRHGISISLLLTLLVSGSLCASLALAQDAWRATYLPELEIHRATADIKIDGRLDDPGWQDAAMATHFAEHQPGDQVQPPFQTEVRICYDDKNLYVSFHCWDDDPSEIRASFCRRDQIFSDDNVIVAIDTFGDATKAYELCVNPYGIQGDLLWSSSGGEDSRYDVIYSTAARITADGWVAEFAIPFKSLRFPNQEEQVWRVDFWRNHPRDVRTQASWAAYDRDESCWPCQWGFITGIKDVRPSGNLDLIPAFTASQAGSRQEDETFENGPVTGEPSLTARYDISSDLSAEATLNPDYSQIESDAAQIDVNSNFALFYPEKRPFFQEGADLWNTYFNAIYTRQINNPSAAGKVLGRSKSTNYGILAAHDRNSPIILPFEEKSAVISNGESFNTIARVRTDFGEQTHVGVVGTDRRYEGGGNGSLVGVDTRVRLNRNYQLEAQYLHSFTTEPDDTSLTSAVNGETFDNGRYTSDFDGETFDGNALYASFERDGRHWGFDLDYWDYSPTFRAENGFEGRNSYREGIARTSYLFRFEESPVLEWLNPGVQVSSSWNYHDVQKDRRGQAWLEGRFRKAQARFHAQYTGKDERYQGIEYTGLYTWHICANARPSDLIVFGGNANYGRQIYYAGQTIGNQEDYGLWFDLKPWDRLLLEMSANWSRSKDPHSDEVFFDGYVMRTKLNLQITRELSARVVIQYNDFRELWEADPLLQYQINPFSIFYVGSIRDYHLLTPTGQGAESWTLTNRQYFLKLQYLFRV